MINWRDQMRSKVGAATAFFKPKQGDNPHRLVPPIKGWKPNSELPPFIVVLRHYIKYGEFKGYVTCGYDEVLGSNGAGCLICDTMLPDLTSRKLPNGKPDVMAGKLADDSRAKKDGLCCITEFGADGKFSPAKIFSITIGGAASWGASYFRLIMDFPGDACHPASGAALNINKKGEGFGGENRASYKSSILSDIPAVPKEIFSARPEVEVAAYSEDMAQLAADGAAWSKDVKVQRYTAATMPSSDGDGGPTYDYLEDETPEDETPEEEAPVEEVDYSTWDEPVDAPAETEAETEAEAEEVPFEVPPPPPTAAPVQTTAPRPTPRPTAAAAPPTAARAATPVATPPAAPAARKTAAPAPPPPPARKNAAPPPPPPPARRPVPPPPPRKA